MKNISACTLGMFATSRLPAVTNYLVTLLHSKISLTENLRTLIDIQRSDSGSHIPLLFKGSGHSARVYICSLLSPVIHFALKNEQLWQFPTFCFLFYTQLSENTSGMFQISPRFTSHSLC